MLEWNNVAFLYLAVSCLLTYMFAIWLGIGFRRIAEAGMFLKRKPRITPDSVLDIEILKFREEKKLPFVTVHLKSGGRIQGECTAYTFTDPREMALKVDGKMVVIFINSEIIAVELEEVS